MLDKKKRGVNMEEENNEKEPENRRLNVILIAILVVSILDFITTLVKG